MTESEKNLAHLFRADSKLCDAAREVAKSQRRALVAVRSFVVELRRIGEGATATAAALVGDVETQEADVIRLERAVRLATLRGRK